MVIPWRIRALGWLFASGPPIAPKLYADAERLLRDYKDEYLDVGVNPDGRSLMCLGAAGYEQLMMIWPAIRAANCVLDHSFRYHM